MMRDSFLKVAIATILLLVVSCATAEQKVATTKIKNGQQTKTVGDLKIAYGGVERQDFSVSCGRGKGERNIFSKVVPYIFVIQNVGDKIIPLDKVRWAVYSKNNIYQALLGYDAIISDAALWLDCADGLSKALEISGQSLLGKADIMPGQLITGYVFIPNGGSFIFNDYTIKAVGVPATLAPDGKPTSVKNVEFAMEVTTHMEKTPTFLDKLKEDWEADKKRWGITKKESTDSQQKNRGDRE